MAEQSTIDQIIEKHGAEAVFNAACDALEANTKPLKATGIQPGSMDDIWKIMSQAHQRMDMNAVTQDQVKTAARMVTFEQFSNTNRQG